MHKLLLISLILSFSGGFFAQKNLNPRGKKHKDLFGGPQDFSNFQPRGIQFSFGPNYTFTKKSDALLQADSSMNGQRFNYNVNPTGRIGFSAQVGMAHFPLKAPKVNLFGNPYRLMSYWDWGLGMNLYGGKEKTTVNYTDATGTNILSTESGTGAFYNFYGSAKISVHKLFYLTSKLRYFIDFGIGANFDYQLGGGNRTYTGIHFPINERFQNPFVAQLNSSLGFGIRLKRGSYFIPGVKAPILGMYEWDKGSPTLHWFSSTYWPVTFQAKFIFLFKQKSNGCNTGSEEDRKKNKEYMQNK
ncbi:MAG: hypothetical protein WC044_00165 [Crocinitomicaceae bacterium]